LFIDDRVREISKASSGHGNRFFQEFFHHADHALDAEKGKNTNLGK
jgi:hypothetical protein